MSYYANEIKNEDWFADATLDAETGLRVTTRVESSDVSNSRKVVAYFDDAGTLQFYEVISRNTWSNTMPGSGGNSVGWWQGTYTYDDSDTEIGYKTLDSNGGSYTKVREDLDGGGYKVTETSLYTDAMYGGGGSASSSVRVYDSAGKYVSGESTSSWGDWEYFNSRVQSQDVNGQPGYIDTNRGLLGGELQNESVTEYQYDKWGNGSAVSYYNINRGVKTTQDPADGWKTVSVEVADPSKLKSVDSGWESPIVEFIAKDTAILSESLSSKVTQGAVIDTDDGYMDSTNQSQRVIYADSAGALVAVVDYNSSTDSMNGNTWKYLNITYYENGAVVERVNETVSTQNGETVMTHSLYDASHNYKGGEETKDGITKVLDANRNVVETKVFIENLLNVSDIETDLAAYDYAPAIESTITSAYSGADTYGIVTSSFDETAMYSYSSPTSTEGSSVTVTRHRITVLDGQKNLLGTMEVNERSADGVRSDLNMSLQDASGDYVGNYWANGNRESISLNKQYDSNQSDSHTLSDGSTYTFTFARSNSWSEKVDGVVTRSDEYYYDGNYNLVFGKQTNGAITSILGKKWEVIDTVITVNDDDLILVDGDASLYKLEVVSEESYMMTPSSTGGSDTSIQTQVTFLKKLGVGSYELVGREESWEWKSADGKFSNKSTTTYDAKNNWTGSSWEDSSGSKGGSSRLTELRDHDNDPATADKMVVVESGYNVSGGKSSSYEYLYLEESWTFLGGFSVENGKKSVYDENWQVIEVSYTVSEAEKAEMVKVTGSDYVLDAKIIGADKVTYLREMGSTSNDWGNGSSTESTYGYFNSEYELLYTETKYESTWSYEGEQGGQNTSVSYSYENFDGEWLGSRWEDSNGSVSSNFRYVDSGTGNRVEYGESSDASGWLETYTWTYKGDSYQLASGERNANGLITKYDSSWREVSKELDPNGNFTFNEVEFEGQTGFFEVRLEGSKSVVSGSERKMLLVLNGNQVDSNIVQSRDIYRYVDVGGYWSESFSIYDGSGNWVGSGSSDSNKNYSESTQVTLKENDSVIGYLQSGKNGNTDGNWEDSYQYEYGANWSFEGGYQSRGGIKTTYDKDWKVISKELDQSILDNLVAVEGGYTYTQDLSQGSYGYMEPGYYGSGSQGTQENTRTLYLDLDKKLVQSKETYSWESADGETWNRSETYYDEDGNWISSSYESSDGYKSSNGQRTLTDDSDNIIGYISSGSSSVPGGDDYSYEYQYNSQWSLVSGWEIRDGIKITYGSGWTEVSREVVETEDTEWIPIRNDLDLIVGYQTKAVVSHDTGRDDATSSTTTFRYFDDAKKLTGSLEVTRWQEEGFWTRAESRYDAEGLLIGSKNEDSEGWEYSYSLTRELDSSGNLARSIDSGSNVDPDGNEFSWRYVYDANGNFVRGSENDGGVITTYTQNRIVESITADISALTAITDESDAVVGYFREELTSYGDSYGMYEQSSTARWNFQADGSFTGRSDAWVYSANGEEQSSGVTVTDSRNDVVYSRSVDSQGSIYLEASFESNGSSFAYNLASYGDSLSMRYGVVETGGLVDGFDATSLGGVELYLDGTQSNGGSEGFYVTGLFNKLVSSAEWSVNYENLDASSITVVGTEEASLAVNTEAPEFISFLQSIDADYADTLALSSLLKDYSWEEIIDDKDSASISGWDVAKADKNGDVSLAFDSGNGHLLVAEGTFRKVDPDLTDNDEAMTQLQSGTIDSFKIYAGDSRDDISDGNLIAENDSVSVELSSIYNELDTLAGATASRYDIA